jgi:hypothetical protein
VACPLDSTMIARPIDVLLGQQRQSFFHAVLLNAPQD